MAGAVMAPRPSPSAARREGLLSPDCMEVMHGPVPVSDGELVGSADGGADVGFRSPDGLAKRGAPRQPRGDGGGKRAAGPVRVAGRDARSGDALKAILVEEDVDALRVFGVAA